MHQKARFGERLKNASSVNGSKASGLKGGQRPRFLAEQLPVKFKWLIPMMVWCTSGVYQALEMVQALEHQLWLERSHRQRAEVDVKVGRQQSRDGRA